ncbi:hypothetical protein IW261DRAFT_1421753 [Armillaria novae-zelandiae]|uniref:Uncharacterized protein n=1 Tax=Armillaria novae-zelandiae TaxID=153914 RepID=A0AA39U7X7_9AGAR|nr:hypothetical protein IW261DRAFT_1421753 [Armillaria novae-zelandiae]
MAMINNFVMEAVKKEMADIPADAALADEPEVYVAMIYDFVMEGMDKDSEIADILIDVALAYELEGYTNVAKCQQGRNLDSLPQESRHVGTAELECQTVQVKSVESSCNDRPATTQTAKVRRSSEEVTQQLGCREQREDEAKIILHGILAQDDSNFIIAVNSIFIEEKPTGKPDVLRLWQVGWLCISGEREVQALLEEWTLGYQTSWSRGSESEVLHSKSSQFWMSDGDTKLPVMVQGLKTI